MLFSCNIANVDQRTFEIVQNSRSREHGEIINYILPVYRQERRKYVDCARASPEISTREVYTAYARRFKNCDIKWRRRGKLTACIMVKLRFRLGLVAAKPLARSTSR